jgi:sulfite exporter TauE/SafE
MQAAEALVLGLASGPVCLASCGPALLPWLAAEHEGIRGTARSLTVFLGGRLAGYMVFAVFAWGLGMAAPIDAPARALLFGVANLGLAAMLFLYPWLPRTHSLAALQPAAAGLHQIGAPQPVRASATATLGLLTGLNLCPPFVAAGVRAAETRSLPGSLAFFLLFFAGTAVWFIPALAVGPLRRIPAAATVARMAMAVLGVYYAYLGITSLSWRLLHA